jgi:4-alpha-glucanotransferase
MQRDGYAWWVARLRYALAEFDLIRLDHFRGFEAYWEIPAGAATAAPGRWVAGPGARFIQTVCDALGELPLVAEDLGVITPAVEALRDQFGLPGMRILQFAFGDDPKASDYQPHNYPRHCVVYTGTHDNDTTVGWFQSRAGKGTTRTAEQIAAERRFALAYLGTDGSQVHWDLIRLALASVADTAIVPLQDVLGLGTAARMNLPGTLEGNWRWRFREEMLTPDGTSRLRELTETYDRIS